jgi:hypothetical protein
MQGRISALSSSPSNAIQLRGVAFGGMFEILTFRGRKRERESEGMVLNGLSLLQDINNKLLDSSVFIGYRITNKSISSAVVAAVIRLSNRSIPLLTSA